jgi:hypothetical protein
MRCAHAPGDCPEPAVGLFTADPAGTAAPSLIALCDVHARQSPSMRVVQRIPKQRPLAGR